MKSIAIALALLVGATAANAADVYSTKDSRGTAAPADFAPVATNKSGVYINGSFGFSSGDRDISGQSAGENYSLKRIPATEDPDGDGPLTATPETFEEGKLNVNHIFDFAGKGDAEGMVFGGGVSYLWQPTGTRLGFELDLGSSIYSDNSTRLNIGGFATDFPGEDNESTSLDPLSGSFKFRRDFDIDLVAKAHLFVLDNVSIYAGAGVSFANASLEGGHHTIDLPPYGTGAKIYQNKIDSSDGSVGLVLAAGAKWWINERVTFGLDYNYKRHDFEFDGQSVADEIGDDSTNGVRRYSSDKLTVEDDLHTVKAVVSLKLN